MAEIVLNGDPLFIPTKLQKVSRYTEKNSGGPNCKANFATKGAKKVIITIAKNAPTNEDVNAAVKASPALPSRAIG